MKNRKYNNGKELLVMMSNDRILLMSTENNMERYSQRNSSGTSNDHSFDVCEGRNVSVIMATEKR